MYKWYIFSLFVGGTSETVKYKLIHFHAKLQYIVFTLLKRNLKGSIVPSLISKS